MDMEVRFYDLPCVDVELPGHLHVGIPGPKGDKGDKGDPGETGPQGSQGEKGDAGLSGATFTPYVDGSGVLHWRNDRNLEDPESVDLTKLIEIPEGGTSSWNDLTDKPFYEEDNRVELFQEQDVEGFAVNVDFGLYYQAVECAEFAPVAGETYSVFWDGQTWDCTVYDASAVVPGCMGLGNGAAFGYPGNNEPFIIAASSSTSIIDFFALDEAASHRIGISKGSTIVKTLDAKFLPMEAIDQRIEDYISSALEGDY